MEATSLLRSNTPRAAAATPGRLAAYLTVYQAGVLLVACLLFAIAGARGAATQFERVEPFAASILGLWGALIVLGCLDTRGRHARSRICGDFLCSLALVWRTGGVESFFLPVLLATVLGSSTVLGMRQAFLLASTATVVLSVTTAFQLGGRSAAAMIGVEAAGYGGRGGFMIGCLVAEAVGIHSIALLGSRLTQRVRRALSISDLIVHSIGEGLIALDGSGRIVLMNPEALRILNYAPDTRWAGARPEQVFRRDEDRQVLEVLQRREPEALLEWRGSRERSFPLAVRVREVRTGVSRSDMWVALLRDETAERRAAVAEARVKILEELEDMALGLAHEIRNPLGSIRGCVQELCGPRTSADQRDQLSRIVLRESDRLDKIVAEFMEFCRTQPAENQSFELKALLQEVLESLRQRPEAELATMKLVLAGGEQARIRGQRELIYRVFYNLGLNALEALDRPGSIRIEVVAGADQGWDIYVTDDGVGIEEGMLRRIFNPFFTTKAREGGLGLSIVEKIVRIHGGTVDVKSRRGVGTTFRIWLPGHVATSETSFSEARAVLHAGEGMTTAGAME